MRGRGNRPSVGGCGWVARSRLGLRPDAGAHQKKQIDEEDGDQDEAADEDVRPESEYGFVAGKVGRGDVVVLVFVFVHADKLMWKWGSVPG